jgi:hypothetical protein
MVSITSSLLNAIRQRHRRRHLSKQDQSMRFLLVLFPVMGLASCSQTSQTYEFSGNGCTFQPDFSLQRGRSGNTGLKVHRSEPVDARSRARTRTRVGGAWREGNENAEG